jgi:putative flippase GtrA
VTVEPTRPAARFGDRVRPALWKAGSIIRGIAGTTGGRLVLFGAVGLTGFLPNLLAVALLTETFRVNYAVASVIATQLAVCWNFLLVDQVVYRQSRTGAWYRRAGQFFVVNNLDLVLRMPLLVMLVEVAHMGYITATVTTLVLMFALRFIATDWIVYRLPQFTFRSVLVFRRGREPAMVPIPVLDD